MLSLLFGLCFLSAGFAEHPRFTEDSHQRVFQTLKRGFKLQGSQPDAACQSYLASTGGQSLSNCLSTMSDPPALSLNNSCMTTNSDYAAYCSQVCYATVTEQFDHIVSTGDCLAYFDSLLVLKCQSDSQCDSTAACYQGNCYGKCTNITDCQEATPCATSSMCYQPTGASSKICYANDTYATSGTPGFKAASYSYKLYCAQSDSNYCGVYFDNGFVNVSALSCNSVASWGCCTGTILNFMTYCAYMGVNNPSIYTCPNSTATCSPLPTAKAYCASSGVTLKASFALFGLLFASLFGMM